MRKIVLLTAIGAAALLAGCAQNGQSASSECTILTTDAFMQAVEEGRCDIDVTTAAGGENAPKKSFDSHGDHGGGGKDGDKGPDKEPEPDPDPEPDPEPGPDADTGSSTEPAGISD